MSEHLPHECGLALVRLRKPLSHYRTRYGDAAWGLRRLYLLMEKQHNRGQDGAGIAMVKFDMPPGETYLRRVRSDKHNALEHVFDIVMRDVRGEPRVNKSKGQQVARSTASSTSTRPQALPVGATAVLSEVDSPPDDRLSPDPSGHVDLLTCGPVDLSLKRSHRFVGELYLGHLRYGTFAGRAAANCHPFVRRSNIASRNLAIAGNFNMTNANELFAQLTEYGLNLVGESDTNVILERIGYFLDREHDYLHATMGPESLWKLDGRELADAISRELDLGRVLQKASCGWDGGYVFAGILGSGDAFVCRDPAGIRPAFFYQDQEVIAVASERAALANVFNVEPHRIEPIRPAHALVIKKDAAGWRQEQFTEALPLRQCTFERIYFSRGNDPDIYQERKNLGRNLAPRVLAALGGSTDKAVFSYIPNTAEAAYMGLLERLDELTRQQHAGELWRRIQGGQVRREDLDALMNGRIRAEKIAHKDQRLRTFITHDAARRDLVMHIYDITRGVVKPDDALVVLDDSIVRGTTLRQSIITILSRLNPAKIIVVSSAPPIMYPDCYGIDMSQLGRFIAFEAAVELLRERDELHVLHEVERLCIEQDRLGPQARPVDHVARIYQRFTLEEISRKVADLVRPSGISWQGPIEVIYQSVEGLRSAMPDHSGDWYFTGNYPTRGGYRVLNTSFLNWRGACDVRAY